MSSGGGSGPPRAAALPTAKTLSPVARRRLGKELDEWLSAEPPVPGMSVSATERLDLWMVMVTGAENTVFANEEYVLRFSFPADYPIEPPEVIFVHPTPRHPHVYTNGHICLNVLYDGWSPALTVTSVCLSILSMLSSATAKGQPPDNDAYVRNCHGRSPKATRWMFHDDKV
ncbi:hypothetical protein I4F81_007754 [Pyropia yezoensis]|uniref:Uncharacterized protein n=1 Tax=Pyropia yezoensis TaxID=2788 RepID=A0ACC3C5G5_PYRYE|nr:hypothetical protein I4F81_007754 [Neopyropia yezoensis]